MQEPLFNPEGLDRKRADGDSSDGEDDFPAECGIGLPRVSLRRTCTLGGVIDGVWNAGALGEVLMTIGLGMVDMVPVRQCGMRSRRLPSPRCQHRSRRANIHRRKSEVASPCILQQCSPPHMQKCGVELALGERGNATESRDMPGSSMLLTATFNSNTKN